MSLLQRHLVTIAHLKLWGYGAFYSTLFTVKEIMSIVRIFRTASEKSFKHSSIECHALSKSRIYCMEYHYFL